MPSACKSNIFYLPEKDSESDRIPTQDKSNDNDVYLSCSVSDTGKGLSDDDYDVLFNRFAQASPKTYIEYGGSGLGLFISRHITELMGGRIGVSRGQNLGSTFSFFIKTWRIRPDEASPDHIANKIETLLNLGNLVTHVDVKPSSTPATLVLQPVAAAEWPDLSRDRPKILVSSLRYKTVVELTDNQVVEDNKINQKLLCKGLSKRGYEADYANHGQEALDILISSAQKAQGKSYFDLVLCDIEMPVLNGIDCVLTIRKFEREGILPGHIPVIAVSANVRREHVKRAEEAGMVSLASYCGGIDFAHCD